MRKLHYIIISLRKTTQLLSNDQYKMCREVITEWFWDPINTPKLGCFGKINIVEMDKSYMPGKLKFNRGRFLGEDSKTS